MCDGVSVNPVELNLCLFLVVFCFRVCACLKGGFVHSTLLCVLFSRLSTEVAEDTHSCHVLQMVYKSCFHYCLSDVVLNSVSVPFGFGGAPESGICK